jgi:Leucine-rich repeat (LRR) protein
MKPQTRSVPITALLVGVSATAFLLTSCDRNGAKKPPSPRAAPVAEAPTPVRLFEPSIKRLPEEEELLEELIGQRAFVYEFSGVFFDLWLEGETEDMLTKETKPFKEGLAGCGVSRQEFVGLAVAGPVVQKVHGKIVVWGDLESSLTVRVSAEAPKVGSASSMDISLPPVPGASEDWTYSLDRGPRVVDLPEEEGAEFTLFEYSHKHTRLDEDAEPPKSTTLGRRTVRLKGRLLAERIPEYHDQPDDAAAVAALESLDVELARYDTGSIMEVRFEAGKASDDDLVHLKGLPNLKEVTLSGSPITDAGLEHLKGLSTLTMLDLSGSEITDAGLEQLTALRQLGFLYLTNTQVTDEGVKKFQEKLPDCYCIRREPPKSKASP